MNQNLLALHSECAKFQAIANEREFNDPRLLPV